MLDKKQQIKIKKTQTFSSETTIRLNILAFYLLPLAAVFQDAGGVINRLVVLAYRQVGALM